MKKRKNITKLEVEKLIGELISVYLSKPEAERSDALSMLMLVREMVNKL